MKCYFHHEQNHFLDYFKDPVPDVPFQDSKREGKYTEFTGHQIGIIFVADNKDYEFLLTQKGNASNMSSNSDNFRKLNVSGNSSNLIQIAAANPGDTSHPTYNAWKRDAEADYLSRLKITLRSCISDINFTDTVNTKNVHEELMNGVWNDAIHISNKDTIQIEPFQFEWDMFMPTLEK